MNKQCGMRIVIAGDHRESRAQLANWLRSDTNEVVEVANEDAVAEVSHQVPQVLLVVLPDLGGPVLLRSLCAADPTGGMYIISVTAEHQPARVISSSFAAGSHDVLCAPYTAQELRARVDVQRRLRRWMSTRVRVVKPEPVRSPLRDLRAWQYLGDVIADDLEAMLGRSLIIEESWPTFTDSIQLATISMTHTSEQLELCISIVADTTTRRWLGTSLLGDAAAPEEALDDVMREIANVAGGALKRAAAVEGPVLSTGIPVDGRSLPAANGDAKCWTIPLEGGVSIAVIGEVRHRANRKIPARRLIEGMVVVTDVRNLAGVLLLPSGTRLTSTTADRLSKLLDLTLIEVSA